jgi:hypothetical protein
MSWKTKANVLAALTLLGAAPGAKAQEAQPTCSDVLDIEVHGQHVVGDYVTGIGHEELGWPPDGSEIGETVADNGGVVIAGGPGPGYHFPNGVAPGASFCTNSQSPGAHL